jgi:hypothetical protein
MGIPSDPALKPRVWFIQIPTAQVDVSRRLAWLPPVLLVCNRHHDLILALVALLWAVGNRGHWIWLPIFITIDCNCHSAFVPINEELLLHLWRCGPGNPYLLSASICIEGCSYLGYASRVARLGQGLEASQKPFDGCHQEAQGL